MNFIIKQATVSNRKDFLKILQCWNMQNGFLHDETELDYSNFFIAEVNNQVVGMAGFMPIDGERYRTRLLAVYPEFRGTEIGKALQDRRLEEMYKRGAKIVETSVDNLEMKHWYKKHYGYTEIYKTKKEYEISFIDVDVVDVLYLNLIEYMKNKIAFDSKKLRYMEKYEPHPLSPYPPLIINVALTGVIPTKTLTKYIPISVNEIIEEAINVYDAGASIVHLHAKDENGKACSDAKYYEKIISGIKKERPELICCATTSGRDGQSVEQRAEVLSLTGNAKPDMASLTLGSLNFLSGASINSIDTVTELAYIMKEKGIKPELEIFDTGMVNLAQYLERHNIINGKKYFNILLGNLNTAGATIKDLSHIYTSLPDNSIWAAAGLGHFQLPMNMASIVAGGHVRVGLEDNIYYDLNKTKLATNITLVNRIKKIANELERPISTAQKTREILGI
uniref:N-acetyltransferase domain-containing protein n=1 Tax=Chlorobium chlorochromatii (strain CaD3) TaxID=340177 RepID=Q3ARY1_CHLCH